MSSATSITDTPPPADGGYRSPIADATWNAPRAPGSWDITSNPGNPGEVGTSPKKKDHTQVVSISIMSQRLCRVL